jgi:hypothetical protein
LPESRLIAMEKSKCRSANMTKFMLEGEEEVDEKTYKLSFGEKQGLVLVQAEDKHGNKDFLCGFTKQGELVLPKDIMLSEIKTDNKGHIVVLTEDEWRARR